jgi:ATP-dependent Zn protease
MGRIIKNIILILVGFLLISGLFAAFSNDTKSQTVPLSEIKNQINQDKVASLTVGDDAVTAKLKDSSVQNVA